GVGQGLSKVIDSGRGSLFAGDGDVGLAGGGWIGDESGQLGSELVGLVAAAAGDGLEVVDGGVHAVEPAVGVAQPSAKAGQGGVCSGGAVAGVVSGFELDQRGLGLLVEAGGQ